MTDKKPTDKRKLKSCPNCRSRNLKFLHCLSSRLPWWWYIECFDCHWCGKTKLGLNRAIKSWNRESEKKWKND